MYSAIMNSLDEENATGTPHDPSESCWKLAKQLLKLSSLSVIMRIISHSILSMNPSILVLDFVPVHFPDQG